MASTTTGLTQLMSTYYDKRFLERAKAAIVFDYGADVKKMPRNGGKVVAFTRFTPLAAATTPLTEATNPSEVAMTATTVSATTAEYGNYTKVGSLFELTSIDERLEEHTDVHAVNASETVDILIRNELSANATARLAAGKSALSDIAATDILNGVEVRKVVRTLKANKAMRFANGYFRAIVQEFTAYDLMGNSEWLDASRYINTETTIKQGILGKFAGVEFVESNQHSTESSTVTVYHNIFCGAHGYGVVDIASTSEPKIYVKTPGEQDTSNPLNMFSTVGWKVTFVAKVLNANWAINLKTGATA